MLNPAAIYMVAFWHCRIGRQISRWCASLGLYAVLINELRGSRSRDWLIAYYDAWIGSNGRISRARGTILEIIHWQKVRDIVLICLARWISACDSHSVISFSGFLAFCHRGIAQRITSGFPGSLKYGFVANLANTTDSRPYVTSASFPAQCWLSDHQRSRRCLFSSSSLTIPSLEAITSKVIPALCPDSCRYSSQIDRIRPGTTLNGWWPNAIWARPDYPETRHKWIAEMPNWVFE
jgi:hypothetical protein